MTEIETLLQQAQQEAKEQLTNEEENQVLHLQNQLYKSTKREAELLKQLEKQEKEFLQSMLKLTKTYEQDIMNTQKIYEQSMKQVLAQNKASNQALQTNLENLQNELNNLQKKS